MGGSRATGKLATLWNPPYSLTNEITESASDEGSADRSRCDAYGGVLLACRGKFPIHQLQKASSSRFFSSRFLIRIPCPPLDLGIEILSAYPRRPAMAIHGCPHQVHHMIPTNTVKALIRGKVTSKTERSLLFLQNEGRMIPGIVPKRRVHSHLGIDDEATH